MDTKRQAKPTQSSQPRGKHLQLYMFIYFIIQLKIDLGVDASNELLIIHYLYYHCFQTNYCSACLPHSINEYYIGNINLTEIIVLWAHTDLRLLPILALTTTQLSWRVQTSIWRLVGYVGRHNVITWATIPVPCHVVQSL